MQAGTIRSSLDFDMQLALIETVKFWWYNLRKFLFPAQILVIFTQFALYNRLVMKSILFTLALVLGFSALHAEDSLYHPKANAASEMAMAVAKAKKENKHVLIQGGGNWCIWCKRFNAFTTTDPQLDSMINRNFVVYHLNYSAENKNETIFA